MSVRIFFPPEPYTFIKARMRPEPTYTITGLTKENVEAIESALSYYLELCTNRSGIETNVPMWLIEAGKARRIYNDLFPVRDV